MVRIFLDACIYEIALNGLEGSRLEINMNKMNCLQFITYQKAIFYNTYSIWKVIMEIYKQTTYNC